MSWAVPSAETAAEMENPESFTDRVRAVIKQVPYGRVVSYGRVAVLSGSPRSARQVAWILSRDSEKFDLPWHRVINASGRISLPGRSGDLQKALLEAEGIVFSPSGTVSLKKFGWSA